jgi:hypothetical protein
MRFGRYSIAAFAADKGEKLPAQSFVKPTEPRRRANGRWARALSNTH